jgi:hypothetical protein
MNPNIVSNNLMIKSNELKSAKVIQFFQTEFSYSESIIVCDEISKQIIMTA